MRVWRGAGAVALVAVGFCACQEALAQVADDVGDVAPFQWGRVQFFPVLTTELEWTDNLYYTSPDATVLVDDPLDPDLEPDHLEHLEPVATVTSSLTPSFVAELPFGKSRARLGYAYRYADYSAADIPANGSHFFEGEARLVFSNGLVANFRDDYQNGVLDTETIDLGGAIRFSGQKFRTNTASAAVGFQGLRASALLTGSVHTVSFPPDRIAAYYDTDSWAGDLSGVYALTQTAKLVGSYVVSRTRLVRPLPPSNAAFAQLELETGARLGADIVFGPGSSLTIRVGRPVWEYISIDPEQFSNPEQFSSSEKFRALVSSVAYRHAVPAGAQVSVDLNRGVYPAVFLTANHYSDERVSFSLTNDLQARLVLGAAVSYYVNRYPEVVHPDVGPLRRLDQSYDANAWIAYRVGEKMEWRFFGRFEHRESNAPKFGYRTGTIGVTFSLGG